MLQEVVQTLESKDLDVPKIQAYKVVHDTEDLQLFAISRNKDLLILDSNRDWNWVYAPICESSHKNTEEAIEFAFENGWKVFAVGDAKDFFQMVHGYEKLLENNKKTTKEKK